MYALGIIFILLDGLLIYLIPSYFNELSLFYPMLSITFSVAIYNYSKDYLKTSFILGVIYDLLYSSIFFYNALLFLLLAKVNKKIFNYLQINIFNKIIVLIINIIIYDSINYLIVFFSKYQDLIFYDLVYKITHSLLLNVLALFVINFLLKKIKLHHKL